MTERMKYVKVKTLVERKEAAVKCSEIVSFYDYGDDRILLVDTNGNSHIFKNMDIDNFAGFIGGNIINTV